MVQYSKSGSGPLLIYLPGMEGTGTLFFNQEPELSRRFTVICLASRRSSGFTYPDLIEDVEQVLETEDFERAVLVGESFGGTVALQFALKHPERVEHLVLINTFSYFRNRFDLTLARMLLPLGFWKPGRWVRDLIMTHILTSEHVDSEAIRRLLQASFSHGYFASNQRLRLIKEHDVREQLDRLSMPVTIVVGAKDRLLPSVKEARFLKKRIPNTRVVILPDLGHTCCLSRKFSLAEVLNEDVILTQKS